MKKILGFVIVLGFVVMLGAAGSVEFVNMSFFKALLLEFLGMAVVLFGTSALMHYKRHLRRIARIKRRRTLCTKVHPAFVSTKKELA